jgi:hypothetical protein
LKNKNVGMFHSSTFKTILNLYFYGGTNEKRQDLFASNSFISNCNYNWFYNIPKSNNELSSSVNFCSRANKSDSKAGEKSYFV